MRLVDLYFEAFRAFRKQTKTESNSQKLRKLIAHSNHTSDTLTSIQYDCELDETWIKNIEEGLIYIEKAIREDRQFIRTEGEVVQIEKVKRVSKASFEHLSRHSDLISRAPKSDDIRDLIPDKLYIVEKLSDYLVYENRFLYMLLSYLKNFIQMRLDKIRDKMTTYQANMVMDKDIKANQRMLKYKLFYDDIQKNDPILIDKYNDNPIITRLETIYATVVSFLSTPLMREVSKAPMIKPPVVKTNVLRMNPNFRAALALYDFVTAYNQDGYAFKEIKKTFQPFPSEMADEIADTIELNASIAYITSHDIREYLTKQVELKEQALLDAENKKTIDELKRLKKRITEMNEDPSLYILKLEKRNVQLEKESSNWALEKELNISLKGQIEALEAEKKALLVETQKLYQELEDKKKEIEYLNQKYYDDMVEAEAIHQSEIQRLISEHEAKVIELQEYYQAELETQKAMYEGKLESQKLSYETEIQIQKEYYITEIETQKTEHNALVESMKTAHQQTVDTLVSNHQEQQQTLILKHESEITTINAKHDSERSMLVANYETRLDTLEGVKLDLNQAIERLKQDLRDQNEVHSNTQKAFETEIHELNKQIKRLEEEKRYLNAQYLALKQQQGLITDADDFTSKEKFKQLELEMAAYKKLFKEQWKKTKQQIRLKVKQEMIPIEEKSESQNDVN